MIVSKECAERGCAGHDPRVDGPGVEVGGMNLRQAAQQALEALEKVKTDADKQPPVYPWDAWRLWVESAITTLRAVLDQPTPVQVSPVDFVELVIEREHMVGKPLYWTQWPNEEKT